MCSGTNINAGKGKNEGRSNKASKICKGVILNIMKHGFLTFRVYFDMFVDFVFSIIWDGSRQAIPDLEKRHFILTKSAVELASMIRKKELKSEELVKVCVERIKIVNPILNAVTDERFEKAQVEAREIDKILEDGVSDDYFKTKPFLGVPFTCKESHAAAGMGHTLGIRVRKHIKAHEDADCVRLLKEAGAILVAVTNVPEINKWQETRNMLFGQTNNPYDTSRTTGGSSGGEAALAASFASPISLCSDMGGSTRMPAFFCGLYAYNPTAGYTSLKGSVLRLGNRPTMISVGFVSKHLEDLPALTKVVAGDKAPELNLDKVVDVKKIKYYYVETTDELRASSINKELRKTMNRVIKKITEETESTDRVPQCYSHKGLNQVFNLWKYWASKEEGDYPTLLTNNRGKANGVVELIKKFFGLSEYSLAAILYLINEQYLPKVNTEWAEKLTQELRDDITEKLGTDGVLLYPSSPSAAPRHCCLLLRPFNFIYWGLANVLKAPAVQIPLGLNKEGLPLGIQVMAGPLQDALCLRAAEHVAQAFEGFVPPCNVSQ